MTDERIIAYLLQELPDDDLERFEDECFAEENWPTQIDLVEEDLIDAYLRAELTPERQQRFEQNYLRTEARHERVSMAAALLHRVDEYNATSKRPVVVSPKKPSWAERFGAFWSSQGWAFRAAPAVAVVLIIAGALGIFGPRTPSPRTFASLTLTISNNNRAEGAQDEKKIKLPPDAEALRISLVLPKQSVLASRYRVELENDNGETKIVDKVQEDAQSVSADVRTAQLTRGKYAVKLFAINTDGAEQRVNGSYRFIVE